MTSAAMAAAMRRRGHAGPKITIAAAASAIAVVTAR